MRPGIRVRLLSTVTVVGLVLGGAGCGKRAPAPQHADLSDFTVPLRGNSFPAVTVHDAYARWAGVRPAYNGPDTVTPDYPTLKQISLAGDFENVLSFGRCTGGTIR